MALAYPLEMDHTSASVFSRELLPGKLEPNSAAVVFRPMRDTATGATWWVTHGGGLYHRVAVIPAPVRTDFSRSDAELHTWHIVGIDREKRCTLLAEGENVGPTPVRAKWATDPVTRRSLVAFNVTESRNVAVCANEALPTLMVTSVSSAISLYKPYE